MAIDPQSAMTPLYFQARPARPPQGLVPVVPPRRVLATAKLAGLITITTIGVTLIIAVAVGSALFAILNIG